MSPSQPYQPLLLRLLHGFTGLFLILAMVTAYWTYDIYDGRWGSLGLPIYQAIEGIHGTFGLYTLLIFPVFVIYAIHRGGRRLVQPSTFSSLSQVGKPIWWYSLNRLANTGALLALTFALFSGKMMDETWLPQGELNHGWYFAHLISWVIMGLALGLHLLLNARVGGVPLLLSMGQWRYRPQDSPTLWPQHLSQGWATLRRQGWFSWLRPVNGLVMLELAIRGTIAAAWILALIKEMG